MSANYQSLLIYHSRNKKEDEGSIDIIPTHLGNWTYPINYFETKRKSREELTDKNRLRI